MYFSLAKVKATFLKMLEKVEVHGSSTGSQVVGMRFHYNEWSCNRKFSRPIMKPRHVPAHRYFSLKNLLAGMWCWLALTCCYALSLCAFVFQPLLIHHHHHMKTNTAYRNAVTISAPSLFILLFSLPLHFYLTGSLRGFSPNIPSSSHSPTTVVLV